MAFLELFADFKKSSLLALRNTLDKAAKVAAVVLSRRNVESILLKIHKDRFEPPGTNRRAQKGPDGTPWEQISRLAIHTRRENRQANQALVDTGALVGSITIVRGRLNRALTTGFARATVGIPASDPNFEKGILHQGGGENELGFGVPARPFIGINDNDLQELDDLINRAAARIF